MATANYKFVISDPKTGRSWQRELEKKKAVTLIGQKLGSEFDAGILGLPGYHLKITGASDDAGFPSISSVAGLGRKRALLSGGPGYITARAGVRRRKTVRGSGVSEDLVQINTKIIKYGKQAPEEILGPTKADKKAAETKAAETKSEEKTKEEAKKE